MNSGEKKILIVEDENVVSLDLRDSLLRLGYQVTEAVNSGQSAIASVQKHRPALVLMDIQLRGEMDGIQAADQIRQRFDLPVVYVTAHSDEATLKRARVTEPYGYLLKPFDERELNVVVEMALFRHQAQKEHEKLLQEQAARAAIEKEHRWLQFLADAGDRLSASLDFEETIGTVARLAVPQLADLTMIQLKEHDTVRTVVVHHAGGKEDLVWELLRRYPPDPALAHGYPRVIRTGQPELLSVIGDDVLAAAAVDAENLRLLRAVGLRAHVCVPLTIRGEVFGALTLATAESNRGYGSEDLDHAMELARRCASALDNARLYQRAQEAIALREDFLAVASHELRTPLAALVLGLQSLQRSARKLGQDVLDNKLSSLERQFDNLTELVDRLLDVSRLSAGKLEINLEDLDLASLVRDVAGRFEESVRAAGSQLIVRTPPELPGRWDALRLGQVLTNLLGNAIKFCEGKPIEVMLDGNATRATLTVRDHGIGITRDKLPHIFNRFERGVSARNYGGLGLGLYVARQLVEAHGGNIRAESEAGQGASFIIDLPRQTQIPMRTA
jgi:signal transduction histidine kinase/DNA-binding NarL/FixJ family response regulator